MAIQKITSGIIADGAIVVTDIADGSITTAKIADANVTAAKLATGAALPSQTGNSTYYLTTDGTTSAWKAQTALTVANTQLTGTITATQVGTTVSQLFGMRNRIINGAMVFDQRNSGATVTPTASAYTLDRWEATMSAASKYSVYQNVNSTASYVATGQYYSVGITSASAYTVGTSEAFTLTQYIEGYNVADMMFGTSGAKTFTLSFWVYSTLTGTFGGAFQNSGRTRSYPFTYTISSANTWEYKTITVAGDTSGTWLTTNGRGLNVIFSLGTGATLSGTAGAWATATYYSATGATSLLGTNGAQLYLTGVQLEIGTSATPFEQKQYGTELVLCQRYYQKYTSAGTGQGINFGGYGFPQSSSIYRLIGSFPITMRSGPTFSYSNLSVSTPGGSQITITSTEGLTTNGIGFDLNLNASGLSTTTPYFLRATSGNSGYVDFSSEL